MNFFTRISNGWEIAMNSFAVLKENRSLIIFPILSGLSMVLVISSFFVAVFAAAGWSWAELQYSDVDDYVNYFWVFGYYVINYFIIVFFNTALIHCTHLYFQGEEPTVRKGLQFAFSRIGAIFSWALLAATVGTILRLIQDNLGWAGKIITALLGTAWSISTFFVVPVIAYEKLGPIDAFKRSVSLMREKWGESLGATFSFGIVNFVGIIALAVLCGLLAYLIHPLVGILLFIVGVFAILIVMSAVRTIFISAVYHDVTGNPVKHFNQQLADNLFVRK